MDHIIGIVVSLASPIILGVFGFLWRVNSKLSALEKQIESHGVRISSNTHKLNQHFEKAFTIRRDK